MTFPMIYDLVPCAAPIYARTNIYFSTALLAFRVFFLFFCECECVQFVGQLSLIFCLLFFFLVERVEVVWLVDKNIKFFSFKFDVCFYVIYSRPWWNAFVVIDVPYTQYIHIRVRLPQSNSAVLNHISVPPSRFCSLFSGQ